MRRSAAVLLVLIMASCSGKDRSGARNGSPTRAVAPERVDSLRGEVLSESDSLGIPFSVAVNGEHLLVSDAAGEPAVHVFRLPAGALVGSFGREGQGPGEFVSVRSVEPVHGRPGEFWVYDITLKRMTHVDVRRLGRPGENVHDRILTFRSDLLPMGPVWTDEATLLSHGIFVDGRLAQFDTAGRLVRTVGPLPPSRRRNEPVTVVQHAYTGTMAPAPSRGLLALATRHADRLEIYHADGRPVAVVQGPDAFDPVYEMETRGGSAFMSTGDDLRFGYLDVAATDREVFALYSGRTRSDHPGRANYGDRVHVYDWSGRLLRVLLLDHSAIGIAVDARAEHLYAVRQDPTPALLRYALRH